MEEEHPEFSFLGKDIIEDTRHKVHRARLYSGTCTMEGYSLNIGIKKGTEEKEESYNIMKTFQHNSLIPYLNFYYEETQARLVVPLTEICFDHWVKKNGWEVLINANGKMTPLFKNIIIDICDVVEKLFARNVLIKNLGWKNLYMANETNPRVLLLVTEAEVLKKLVSKLTAWVPVRDIIQWCYKECSRELTGNSKRYHDFIGHDKFSVKALRTYPEDWDSFTKGEYLLALIAAKQSVIRAGIRGASISWPLVNGKLPELLSKIVDEENKQGRNCNTKVPFDYVNLIRNKYKHFDDLPYFAKAAFGNREGLIKYLESLTPTFWQDLYEVIGWP